MADPLPRAALWTPTRPTGGAAFTWAALAKDGTVYAEEQFGTIRLVPRHPDNPIVALAAVPLADMTDGSRYYRVHVPPDAEPIVFRRHMRSGERGHAGSLTVLGWRSAHGAGYLWISDSGAVQVSDRDLYDIEGLV